MIKSFCNCKMAGTNVESARQKSAGDEIVSAEFLPSKTAASSTGCNHPLALVVDRTERELRGLEVMLSNCPNCSRWTPGNGPIMAVLSSTESQDHKAPEDFT